MVRDGEPLPRPFLDLSDRISCCGEQGLLSLAFAPDYPNSGLLYVDYTDVAGDTRVVEYHRASSDPPAADPASARQVLAVDQPYSNHNGGLVVFGPDGDLYVGLGDGGGEGDPDRVGQDLSTLLAKILRIDPHARVGSPTRSPATTRSRDKREHGARSGPMASATPGGSRSTPPTGTIAIGDVGQNEFEEVDLAPHYGAGDNFGWSAFEGDARYNDDQSAPGRDPAGPDVHARRGLLDHGRVHRARPFAAPALRALPLRRLLRRSAAELRRPFRGPGDR